MYICTMFVIKFSRFPICSQRRLPNDNDDFRFTGNAVLTSRFIIILFLEIFVLRLTFLAKYHPLIQLSFKDNISIYRHVVHCQTENKSCHPSTNMISSFCRKIFCLPFQFTAAVDMSILDFFLHENVAFYHYSILYPS